MLSYIEEIITPFDKADSKGKGMKSSAALNNLFVVNEYCKKMDQEKFVLFHSLVENTLYYTKRARPDTCTAITFLKTRVQVHGDENWAKLVHLMQYFRGTSKISLTLSANESGILKWWVDASFSVHPNM